MNSKRKGLLAGSVIAAMAAGGVFGATGLARTVSGAASTNTTAASSSTAAPNGGYSIPPSFDPSKGGHTANGITESVLTGDTAAKVKAAALAAVPGGTIQRVENDAE